MAAYGPGMPTVLNSNVPTGNLVAAADPGWEKSEISKANGSLFTELTNHNIAVLVGKLNVGSFASETSSYFPETEEGEDITQLEFIFKRPDTLDNVYALQIEKICIYDVQEAEGTQEKLFPADECLSGDAIVPDTITRKRKRYHFTKNSIYIEAGGKTHEIEIFPYNTIKWLTIEELLQELENKLLTYITTKIDANAIVLVQISSNGYFELLWESLVTDIKINISDLFPKNNFFKHLLDVFHIQSFTRNVSNPAVGVTNGNSLEFSPSASIDNENSIPGTGCLAFFSSYELSRSAGKTNTISGAPSSCIAVGNLDDVFSSKRKGSGWSFSHNTGDMQLFTNKMNFDPDEVAGDFSVTCEIVTKAGSVSNVSESVEFFFSRFTPYHRIRMILYLRLY